MTEKFPFFVTVIIEILIFFAVKTFLDANFALLLALFVVGTVVLRENAWVLIAAFLTNLAFDYQALDAQKFKITVGLLIGGSLLEILKLVSLSFFTGLKLLKPTLALNTTFAIIGIFLSYLVTTIYCPLPNVQDMQSVYGIELPADAQPDQMFAFASIFSGCFLDFLEAMKQHGDNPNVTNYIVWTTFLVVFLMSPWLIPIVFAALAQTIFNFSLWRFFAYTLKGLFIQPLISFFLLLCLLSLDELITGGFLEANLWLLNLPMILIWGFTAGWSVKVGSRS